ncbi:MAG: hypothetical protein ACK5YR_08080 [Pirellula sp.]|jgi:hypothetical protein
MRTDLATHKIIPLVSQLSVFITLFVVCLGCENLSDVKSKSQSTSVEEQSIFKSTKKGGVQLDIEVSPKQPRLSDLVDLTITIVHPSSIKIEPPVFGQSVGDFAVRDYSERTNTAIKNDDNKRADSTESIKQDTTTQVIRYKLEPMFSGKHLIRSIPIVFIETSAQGSEVRDIVQSEPIEVDVVSEFGAVSSDLSQVDPMTDPIAPKQSYLWVGLGALALCSLLLALAIWLVRRQNYKQFVAPVISPEEVAQQALIKLIAEELPSRGMVKEFYLRLTGIVRVFIEGKTGLRAPEQTTEEFLRDMRASSRFDGPQAYRLQEFLTAADLVKYAGQTPDESSITTSVERAREFIAIRFDKAEEASPSYNPTEGMNG